MAYDVVLPMSFVPPQASAFGDDAGKSQCTDVWPLGSSLAPLSPAATAAERSPVLTLSPSARNYQR